MLKHGILLKYEIRFMLAINTAKYLIHSEWNPIGGFTWVGPVFRANIRLGWQWLLGTTALSPPISSLATYM